MGFTSYNDYTLNETYDSFVDLKKLANDILQNSVIDKSKSDSRWHYLVRGTTDPNIHHDEIYPISKFTKREYSTLGDFVDKVGIMFKEKTLFSTAPLGAFAEPDELITVSTAFSNDNKRKKLQLRYPAGIIFIYTPSLRTIIHELEHAWDFYRSKGKYTKTKSGETYFKEVNRSGENTEERKKHVKELYVRSMHELSAFFTAAVAKTDFFYGKDETDFKPFNVVYDEFKDNFEGWWQHLGEDEKKRVTRKFSQYYYRLKERTSEAE